MRFKNYLISCNYTISGFTDAYCTYTVQDTHSKAVIGLYVAHKHQVMIYPIISNHHGIISVLGLQFWWNGAIQLQKLVVEPCLWTWFEDKQFYYRQVKLSKNCSQVHTNIKITIYNKSYFPSELSAELPEDYPVIQHFYDVWHFIKSIQKDLWKAEKLKSCSGKISENNPIPSLFITIP